MNQNETGVNGEMKKMFETFFLLFEITSQKAVFLFLKLYTFFGSFFNFTDFLNEFGDNLYFK